MLSAGILLYRGDGGTLEVWIGHMGGPFWARKDEQAWSIPKGLVDAGEDTLAAARREFAEEIGVPAPDVAYELLGDFRQRSGKTVRAYAAEAPTGFDVETVSSNTFEMEWPRGSGVLREFPEIDTARWVPYDDALRRVVAGQEPMLRALADALAS
ncbi:DNA mismatch repair protein MutT [Subtercola boreus]|uniref:DNA mismatch repair protein MutT n=1 Tax=Subtercola boreus TaxID=120213 RepID=A0A3E0WCF3_9MICO|nr:DNA mismatch repair protein MutT [Subtercola boreus]RFA20220.1 DNA mismatch repair protein MutT [Subtercola boreus]RFA26546.1 DNA mismatch repair protein MutT [Subtercola boreus]